MDWGDARALETPYKGYRFRSRLEARWAVFMDAITVEWEYEPEGFNLGRAGFYLPDFWLPTEHAWLEVKPSGSPPIEEYDKFHALAELSRFPVFVMQGWLDPMTICEGGGFYNALPEPNERGSTSDLRGTMWAACLACGATGLAHSHGVDPHMWCGHSAPGTSPELERAWSLARGQRFGRA